LQVLWKFEKLASLIESADIKTRISLQLFDANFKTILSNLENSNNSDPNQHHSSEKDKERKIRLKEQAAPFNEDPEIS
jgi:hypothetical protein